MRHVRKIRSPRCWSPEERFTRDPATLACSLAPPSNPHKTGQPFAMELPSLLPPGASCVQWLFFKCHGHCPHWNSSSVMQSLRVTVYGCQKCVKVGERVHVWTYSRPWWTVFWLALSFGRNNCKNGARTRNAWRSACDSSRAMQTDPWSQ